MPLVYFSFATGIIFTALGFLIAMGGEKVRSAILGFPRSQQCSMWFVGMATVWFLLRHVANLSEADFGNYKFLIGTIAISTAILSFRFVPDFLAVRGLAMLILLWSREVLDSAFLHDANSRLILVSIIYGLIISSIYLGAWPYRMREILIWLNAKNGRMNFLGLSFGLSGFLIFALSFTY